MLKFGNKEFRNLQEQVEKNMKDILFILQEEGVLNEFGIKVVGQEASIADMPTVEAYKASHEDWSYGDAYAIGTEAPYELYILTRANGTHASDYWFNIGEFPVSGPQGPQGETGPQGPQGQTGRPGADGTSAGFGTVTATAVTLEPSEEATVNVITSGTNVEKNFAFTFGIPKGKPGETPAVEWGDIEGTLSNQSDLVSALQGKQNTLVSGTNIKTINNESILGSGNINIEAGGAVEDVKVNGVSVVDAQGVAEVTVPTKVSDLTNDSGFITSSALSGYATESYVQGYHDSSKQDTLVSGTNIKTINNESILGSGNIVIQGGGGSITDVEVNGTSVVDQEGVAKITVPTATSDLTNDSGFITSSALSGYATKTWVGEQGYLTSVSWNDVSGKPTFATVATSGSYNDLLNKPTIPDTTYMVTTDTEQTITGVKTFSNGISVESITVADVLNVPSIQTAELITGTNDSITIPSNKSGTLAVTSDIPSLTGYATESYVQGYHDSTKQDVISDLSTIRSGAALGATAVQPAAIKNMVTTNTMQEITAIKHFKNGLTVNGEFSSQGSFTLTSFPTKPAEISFDSINSEYTKTLSIGTTTDDRTIELPDKSGTIALTSDIPFVSNIVTTDTNQTISGYKTFTSGIKNIDALEIQASDSNYTTYLTSLASSANVDIELPSASGTLALTSQIPSTMAWSSITGKPSFATVATSGSYDDLSNKPTIPDVSHMVTDNTAQTITGVKTFSSGVKFSSRTDYNYRIGNSAGGATLSIFFGGSNNQGATNEKLRLFGNAFSGTGDVMDLGTSSLKWKDLYLSGNLKDGTNSISIANIQPKLTAGTGIAISNNVISSTLEGIDYEVDDQLPATGKKGIIYLIPNGEASSENIYDEYIWIPHETSGSTGRFEFIGTTQTDLSNYVQISRTINNKPLSANVTLTASDVGAVASITPTTETWTFTLSDGTTTTKTIVTDITVA